MCYCAKIKEIMKLSKEENREVISAFSEGIIYVKYCEQYDDYKMQYSWIINEGVIKTREEVQKALSKYLPEESKTNQDLDITQIGLVCVYNTNADHLCSIIELSQKKKLEYTRDTKYIFFGKKVLRVIQYYGECSNPFDSVENMITWDDPNVREKIKDQKFTNLMRDVDYYYQKDSDSAIFALGTENKKVVFTGSNDKLIPTFLYIDSMQGVVEHNITD